MNHPRSGKQPPNGPFYPVQKGRQLAEGTIVFHTDLLRVTTQLRDQISEQLGWKTQVESLL